MVGKNLMVAFIVAFIVTFFTTPFVKNLAFKIGAVDIPKDNRRMHKKPTARLGGLAIFLGFIASAIIFADLSSEIVGMLIGCAVIVTLGVFDDIYTLSAKVKLLVQIVAALCPVKIDFIRVPSFISEYGYIGLGWFAIPLTVLWIVGITNAVNLLDGLDGLACGVSSISALTLLVIAIIVGEGNVAFLTSALAGACFGFLPYNFNPAKLFMGDTGALFLGFILSSVSVQGLFKGYAIISIAAPLLILGLPIFDTLSAILRRVKDHRSIMSPDRGHLHHRLVDSGFSQKQAVLTIYLLCIVLCLAAVVLIATGAVSWWVFIAVILGLILFLTITPKIIELRTEKDDQRN